MYYFARESLSPHLTILCNNINEKIHYQISTTLTRTQERAQTQMGPICKQLHGDYLREQSCQFGWGRLPQTVNSIGSNCSLAVEASHSHPKFLKLNHQIFPIQPCMKVHQTTHIPPHAFVSSFFNQSSKKLTWINAHFLKMWSSNNLLFKCVKNVTII